MIPYIISLVGSYLSNAWVAYWFFPLIALAFLATFPYIFRYIFRSK